MDESDQQAPERERLTHPWQAPVGAAAVVALIAVAVWAFSVISKDGTGEDATPAAQSSSSSAAGSTSASASPSSSASPTPVTEHYEMPARPLVLTAPGWKPDVVDGYDVTWTGPGGAKIKVLWFTYMADEDPFSLKRVGSNHFDRRGRAIRVLGERTRLTGFTADDERHQIAIPTPLIDRDGSSVVFDGTGLSTSEFTKVLASADAVALKQYDKLVKPAVG